MLYLHLLFISERIFSSDSKSESKTVSGGCISVAVFSMRKFSFFVLCCLNNFFTFETKLFFSSRLSKSSAGSNLMQIVSSGRNLNIFFEIDSSSFENFWLRFSSLLENSGDIGIYAMLNFLIFKLNERTRTERHFSFSLHSFKDLTLETLSPSKIKKNVFHP